MNRRVLNAGLAWAAAIVAVVGLVMTAQSVSRRAEVARRLSRKAADLGALQALQHTVQRQRAILADFEQRGGQRPVPLNTVLKTVWADLTPELKEQDVALSVPGWTARRVSVTLTDVEYDGLARFFQLAEAQRPPWCLVECSVRASPQAGRAAQADLVLEAIERSDGKR